MTDRIVRPTLSGFSKYDKALTEMMVTWWVQIGLKEYMNKHYCFNALNFQEIFCTDIYKVKGTKYITSISALNDSFI